MKNENANSAGESAVPSGSEDVSNEGALPLTAATASESPAAEAESEKRRGFHPVLVLSTIGVVLFVLWFCPWALMRARISQNEAAAVGVLTDLDGRLIPLSNLRSFNDTTKISDKQTRLVGREYVLAARALNSGGTRIPVAWLVPRYHGSTARRTVCRFNTTVYAKDLGVKVDLKDLPIPDETWDKVATSVK